MTDASGPRSDDPHPPRLFYPPGFEPGPTDDSERRRTATHPASPAAPRPTINGRVARRPAMAGFLGTALVALIGFSGGFLVAPAVSGHGGDRPVSQGTTTQGTAAQGTTTQNASVPSPLRPPGEDGRGGNGD